MRLKPYHMLDTLQHAPSSSSLHSSDSSSSFDTTRAAVKDTQKATSKTHGSSVTADSENEQCQKEKTEVKKKKKRVRFAPLPTATRLVSFKAREAHCNRPTAAYIAFLDEAFDAGELNDSHVALAKTLMPRILSANMMSWLGIQPLADALIHEIQDATSTTGDSNSNSNLHRRLRNTTETTLRDIREWTEEQQEQHSNERSYCYLVETLGQLAAKAAQESPLLFVTMMHSEDVIQSVHSRNGDTKVPWLEKLLSGTETDLQHCNEVLHEKLQALQCKYPDVVSDVDLGLIQLEGQQGEQGKGQSGTTASDTSSCTSSETEDVTTYETTATLS